LHVQIEFVEFVRLMGAHNEAVELEKELLAAFKRFDTRGVGRINAQDLTVALAAQGEKLTPAEVQEMMAEADPRGTGVFVKRLCMKHAGHAPQTVPRLLAN
jgi:calmodulin